jgi:hypothetical protein
MNLILIILILLLLFGGGGGYYYGGPMVGSGIGGVLLGRVGSTGRATGPHLFFGIRWHDARIDPHFVLEMPSKIPEVQDPS